MKYIHRVDISELSDKYFSKRETLLRIKKDEKIKIKEVLDRRSIEYFIHFTRIENLSSILENGLIPVSIQNKRNITSIHNDEQRIDSQLDCTSCSVEFPNYKLFYTFREYKYPGEKWVVIVLDTDVLFSPDNMAYFCHTNAAGVLPRVSCLKELCTASSFEDMFCNSITTKENRIIQRSKLQIGDHFTTDPQAEILISDIIDSKYILGVCFYEQSDVDEYIKKNGAELLSKFDYDVVSFFFDAREDYLFWKKES